ncbi:MAG: SRPBCC domain-containing protein [Caldilineaceae bacterium]
MMPVTIQKEIEIAASAASVWQFLGSEAGLRQWWGTELTLEAKPGGRCEERSLYQGRVRCLRGQVTTYDPPRQLTLLLRPVAHAPGEPAWMTISLTLHETQGRTRVALVHQAFDFVHEQEVVGQFMPSLPSSLVAPQANWRAGQPQTAFGSGAAPGVEQPLGVPQYTAVADRNWLAQTEAHWRERLLMLAHQIPQAQ